MNILTVSQLSFKYKDNPILQDITFSVNTGEFISIIGPNGTGKTTLLKCINQVVSVPEQTIILFGKDIKEYSLIEKAKIIAYVPQQTQVMFSISVIEGMIQGRSAHQKYRYTQEDYDKVYEMMEFFEISHLALRNMNEISGGERQMVLVARALIQEPHLLLLDEPTSALDMKNQIMILNKLEKLIHEKHLSVIMTIHDLNLASMYSHRILALQNQRIYKNSQPNAVITKKMIQDMYGIEADIIHTEKYPQILLKK